ALTTTISSAGVGGVNLILEHAFEGLFLEKMCYANWAMNKRKSQPHPLKHSAAHQSDEILVLIIVALYCLVDFLPSFGRADAAPPQFLYLNLLNLLVLLIFWARPTLWWGSPGQPGEWKAQPQLLFY